MRRKKNTKKTKVFRYIWLYVLSALLCFIVIILFTSILKPVQTSFNINVRTEKLEFLSRGSEPVTWVLETAEIAGDSLYVHNGLLDINDSVQVMVRRRSQGDMWINLRTINQIHSVGKLKSRIGETIQVLGAETDIYFRDFDARVKKGQSVVLTVTGEQFSLGRPSGKETTGSTELLLSGSVAMLDESIFQSSVFQAGSFELNTGDHFTLTTTNSRSQGLVVVDNTAGFSAIYRVKGKKGEITRPGGAQFTVSSSMMNKIFNDPFFKAISLVFSIIIVLISLISFIIDIKSYKSE